MFLKSRFIVFLVVFISMHASAGMLESRLAFVGDSGSKAYLGARQGLDEANLQGNFLNHSYSMDVIDPDKASSTDFSPYIAIISAADKNTFIALINSNTQPVFNVLLKDDDLRLICAGNSFHIYPAGKMQQDAVAQWHSLHPDDDVIARTWHPDFVKFAARDLNKRFSKAYQVPMDDAAWSGWAAVKMTSEGIIRLNITDSNQLLTFLRDKLQFDGQMGIELNFRPNGQLRQPMLLIKDNSIVGEAPVRGVSDDLDSLGTLDCAQ